MASNERPPATGIVLAALWRDVSANLPYEIAAQVLFLEGARRLMDNNITLSDESMAFARDMLVKGVAA